MIKLLLESIIYNSNVDYVQPTRNFSLSYVILDSIFVVLFMTLLLIKKKKLTFLFSLSGGVLYFLVDFLIFYLATKSREIYYSINNTDNILCNSFQTCLILFWMSMSYGIMDFAFIWLWLDKDKNAIEYSMLIVIWWICCPLIADFFNNIVSNPLTFVTTRSTNKYHGVMGIIMIVGYAIIIIMNIFNKDNKEKQIPIIKLFIIGFMAQFLWEFILFIFGIRSQNYSNNITRILTTMLQDSLVETNLGMPYLYFIHKAISNKVDENLKLKEGKK